MVLQDFLGSCRESYRILQDPIGSCLGSYKILQDPGQDPETFCRILQGSYQDPVVGSFQDPGEIFYQGCSIKFKILH